MVKLHFNFPLSPFPSRLWLLLLKKKKNLVKVVKQTNCWTCYSETADKSKASTRIPRILPLSASVAPNRCGSSSPFSAAVKIEAKSQTVWFQSQTIMDHNHAWDWLLSVHSQKLKLYIYTISVLIHVLYIPKPLFCSGINFTFTGYIVHEMLHSSPFFSIL